jgi:phosphoribosyl 1,2-cyclic phosphodiesterase
LEPGEHRFAGFTVAAAEIPHKGGRTFGYRVSDGRATLAYLSDHGPVAAGAGPDGLGERHPAALALAADVDVLIHDAQHTVEEFPRVAGFGHSTVDYAVDLGTRSRAGTVALFHHDPDRTDDEIDAIVAAFAGRAGPPAVVAAREDLMLRL